jgi:hypothetical protein
MLQSKELGGVTGPEGRKQKRRTGEITYTKPTKIEEDKMDGKCSTHGKLRFKICRFLYLYCLFNNVVNILE